MTKFKKKKFEEIRRNQKTSEEIRLLQSTFANTVDYSWNFISFLTVVLVLVISTAILFTFILYLPESHYSPSLFPSFTCSSSLFHALPLFDSIFPSVTYCLYLTLSHFISLFFLSVCLSLPSTLSLFYSLSLSLTSFSISGTEEGSLHRCSVSYNEQVLTLPSPLYPSQDLSIIFSPSSFSSICQIVLIKIHLQLQFV